MKPIKNRVDLINFFIQKNKYINYLEIGVRDGRTFKQINALHKDGVDPGIECSNPTEVNYPMISDEFFDLIKDHKDIKYDIIFIDGLHLWEQVNKDINNSLNHLVDNGVIILHDCNPLKEEHQIRNFTPGLLWNGDVWKAILKHRIENSNIKITTISTDHGLGIIQKGTQENYKLDIPFNSYNDIPFSVLDNDRKNILNLITPEEFLILNK
jgi:hypothetical protein